jgi:phosphoribosylformimino-5-aminoimidazole carboxamide ribotide isomerase
VAFGVCYLALVILSTLWLRHSSFLAPARPLLSPDRCGIFRLLIATLRFEGHERPGWISAMQIWPAIDLRGGKCVRLRQGDYQRETVYGDDPGEMARRWVGQGATCLHLVDLDGARDGSSANLKAVQEILAAVSVPCELGGGIRDDGAIERLLGMGLARLVIGTRALKEPDWFRGVVRRFPGKLALGIDAKGGLVATDGWLKTSTTRAVELARQFAGEPLAAIIYTDIARDGMLEGPNLDAMAEMSAAVEIDVIASGGVTTGDDVRRLAALGVAGCIVGRALYEGTLTLGSAIEAAREDQKSKVRGQKSEADPLVSDLQSLPIDNRQILKGPVHGEA